MPPGSSVVVMVSGAGGTTAIMVMMGAVRGWPPALPWKGAVP